MIRSTMLAIWLAAAPVAAQPWTPEAVNTPQGVACPAVLKGAAGACFPDAQFRALYGATRATSVKEAARLLPNLQADLADLTRVAEQAEAATDAAKAEASSLRRALAAKDVQVTALEQAKAALSEALQHYKDALKEAGASSWWKWALAGVGFVGAVWAVAYAVRDTRPVTVTAPSAVRVKRVGWTAVRF